MDGLNYAMMDDCMRIGISGGCGIDCDVYQEGDCTEPDGIFDDHLDELLKEQEYNNNNNKVKENGRKQRLPTNNSGNNLGSIS